MYTFVMVVLSTTLLSSCGESVEDYPENNKISNTVINGNWRVELFMTSSQNRTSELANYTFAFSPNGTVTATNSSMVETGSWSSNDYTNRLYLNFNVGSALHNISNEWYVNSSEYNVLNCTINNTEQVLHIALK